MYFLAFGVPGMKRGYMCACICTCELFPVFLVTVKQLLILVHVGAVIAAMASGL